MAHFHHSQVLLRDGHLEKLESLHKGLSICLYSESAKDVLNSFRAKFNEISSQITNTFEQATKYYDSLDAGSLQEELLRCDGTYSVTDLVTWLSFLSTSYKQEYVNFLPLLKSRCLLKQQILTCVRYDLPEEELSELCRIWSEDTHIDSAEGSYSYKLILSV